MDIEDDFMPAKVQEVRKEMQMEENQSEDIVKGRRKSVKVAASQLKSNKKIDDEKPKRVTIANNGEQ